MPTPTRSRHVSAALGFGSIDVRTPIAAAGERIGLLGGSFNPAHQGHLQISRFALERLQLDRVWWLVSPGNPIKSHAGLEAQVRRIEGARAVAGRDRRIVVTGFEVGLPSAFTASTLEFLRLRHRATRFVWLMGADCLPGFHNWHRWEAILATMPVAVVDRPGWRLRAMSSRAAMAYRGAFVPEVRAALVAGRPAPAWTFLTAPLSPLSSTALRAAARPKSGTTVARGREQLDT